MHHPGWYRRRGAHRDERPIQAMRVTDDNVHEVMAWCNGRLVHVFTDPIQVVILPSHSTVPARIGDYVVKALEGDYWYSVLGSLFDAYYTADRGPR